MQIKDIDRASNIDWSKAKVGIANAGGSLKGVAFHTGFYKALLDYNLEPEIIVGTSAGAIIGQYIALYGVNETSLNQLDKIVVNLTADDYIDRLSKLTIAWRLIRAGRGLSGYIKGERLEDFIREIGQYNSFDNLKKIKFGAHVANLTRRRQEILTEGDLAAAARASATIPLVFQPVKIQNQWYVDGGVFGYHAADHLLDIHPDLDVIIVVDFHLNDEEPSEFMGNKWVVKDIVQRCLDSQAHEYEKLKFELITHKNKDVVLVNIRPKIPVSINLLKPDKKTLRRIIDVSYNEASNLLYNIING